MDELALQTKEVLEGKPVTMEVFPFQVRTVLKFCFGIRILVCF